MQKHKVNLLLIVCAWNDPLPQLQSFTRLLLNFITCWRYRQNTGEKKRQTDKWIDEITNYNLYLVWWKTVSQGKKRWVSIVKLCFLSNREKHLNYLLINACFGWKRTKLVYVMCASHYYMKPIGTTVFLSLLFIKRIANGFANFHIYSSSFYTLILWIFHRVSLCNCARQQHNETAADFHSKTKSPVREKTSLSFELIRGKVINCTCCLLVVWSSWQMYRKWSW